MTKRIRAIILVLAAGVGGQGIAAMHSETLPTRSQELILKSGPMPSGIYNLRRQRANPLSKGTQHRKPRPKSASETVAAVN